MTPARRAWLERCLTAIALDPLTATESVGLPCGAYRPELGPNVQDLQCVNCEATWAGIVGEPCEWCEKGLQRQTQYQIDLLLTPPDTDPADATYEARVRGWLQRMKVGVEAGLITKQQAETAFRRTQRKTAA